MLIYPLSTSIGELYRNYIATAKNRPFNGVGSSHPFDYPYHAVLTDDDDDDDDDDVCILNTLFCLTRTTVLTAMFQVYPAQPVVPKGCFGDC